MTKLFLVRHGQAAAGYDSDLDPGLDEVGRAQAEAMAGALEPRGPLPMIVSPLRRTRETAAVLERRWGVTARVDPVVGEIPSDESLAQRGEWLRRVLQGTWADATPALGSWRDSVVDALAAIGEQTAEDTVVVTHFVAINAAVGAATGDDRLVCFRPGNCSITVLESAGGGLRVVELGDEAVTVVQ